MRTATFYRYVERFAAGIQFTAIHALYERQASFTDCVTGKIQGIYRSRGYGLDDIEVNAMKSDGDYILLQIQHDRLDCIVTVTRDNAVVRKLQVKPPALGDFTPICEAILASICDSAKETLGMELQGRMTDWQHSFEVILRLMDRDANNMSVVGNLLRPDSPLLRLLPLSNLFRLDLTLSGVNPEASDRNCWLTVEAPANENNSQLWLKFSVKPYPPEQATAADKKQQAFDDMSAGAFDIQRSLGLFNTLFVAEFLPELVGQHDVEQVEQPLFDKEPR